MATKPDLIKAQKERKQKILLAVGGVLLIGVLALQLPKLLKHSSSADRRPGNDGRIDRRATPPADGSAATAAPTGSRPLP